MTVPVLLEQKRFSSESLDCPTESKSEFDMDSGSVPNILVIITDQQRADSISCYGAKALATPNLDRLAAEGIRFSNCIVNNPICTPSRASMMTGQELPGHGVYRLHDILSDSQTLFPHYLRGFAGYHTALFGKLHVSGEAIEEKRRHPRDGFDDYEWCLGAYGWYDSPFNAYSAWLREHDPRFLEELISDGQAVKHHSESVHFTRWAAERTINYIRRKASKKQHFCCVMSIFDPHNPYGDYPLSMARRVVLDKIDAPLAKLDLPECVRREQEGSVLGSGKSKDEIKSMRFGYAASVAFADQEIGRVLEAIDSSGIAQETLVIFVSDHGDSLGDHGLLGKGVGLYEPVIRVPLLMRWPGRVPPGLVSDAIVQPHDIPFTCLKAAKLRDIVSGAFATGVDLVGIANGNDSSRRYAYCAYRNSGINSRRAYWDPPMSSTAVRSKEFKLIAYSSGTKTEFELFDLRSDPTELTNRFEDPVYAGTSGELMTALAGWLQLEACSQLRS